jgi:dipeptidyl aminopeptidase/acylaminoacyl peptidase
MTGPTRLAALALCLAAAAAPACGAPFTAKIMASLERIDDPRLSPDGRHVIYSLRSVDYTANKAATALWVLDLKTHATRKLTADGASSGRWSPDGKAVYFISGRKGGVDQVFRTAPSGGAALQVTKGKLDVGSFRLAPDGKRLVVSYAVFPDCPDLACTVARKKAIAASKATGVVYDRLFVRHWDKWADGTRNHLYALPLTNGVARATPVSLMQGFDGDTPTTPFGGDDDYTISPDGKYVVFSAKLAGKSEAWTTNFDLWLAPTDGSRPPQNLTAANKAMDAAPLFSPDGKWLAYRAMKRPGFEADRFAILLREVATGKTREVAPKWDRSADTLAWRRDGLALYAVADDLGQRRLFSIDIRSGRATPRSGTGHVGAVDVGSSSVFYTQDNLSSPADLYSTDLSGGVPVRLTGINAKMLKGVAFGQAEQFAFKGWNNETVHGYLVRPVDYRPGRKYPVAFLIHGGPQGSMGNDFHYRWNPQVYAGAGYAAVMIDFHGSSGYGQAFTDAISRHWGDRPLEDLQKGWAYALAKYPFLDGGRACALGGSYGGYMVTWIAGVWNQPWRCLVDHDGSFDLRGMGYATEELWFDEWEAGGTLYDNPAGHERFNPFNHVGAWSKPMLVIQGGRDYRIPLDQALGTFTALQRRGVPSKFLYFPDENHWVLKPQNSVQWYGEVLGWMDRWTKPSK